MVECEGAEVGAAKGCMLCAISLAEFSFCCKLICGHFTIATE